MICSCCVYLRYVRLIIVLVWFGAFDLMGMSIVEHSYDGTAISDSMAVNTDAMTCKKQLHHAVDSVQHLLISLEATSRRDSATIILLANYCHRLSAQALQCHYHTVAMFFVSVANNALSLQRSRNILLFRMAISDMRVVLRDIKRRLYED